MKYIFLALLFSSLAQAQSTENLSLTHEIKLAIARGNKWLESQQKADGHWDDSEMPAFTAFVLTAASRDPNIQANNKPEYINKGFTWLLNQQKADGGIYNKGLSVYNTATALTALISGANENYEPAIIKARKHLIQEQWDTGEKGKADGLNDGGIGYGSKKDHTDLSNTYLAIEALALSKKVIEDGKHGDQPDLDWGAATTFLSRCQNLEESNDQAWASNDDKNKGGFVYNPTESKVSNNEPLPNGKVPLRSYGSMSYAGLLSLIYAKLDANDKRVIAVKEWLGKNYTLDENPGLGAQGLYYYYSAMAKALAAANIDQLPLANGKTANWRKDLGEALLSKQREDGSWTNANGRWMESNSILTTSYTILALEQIYYSMPQR